MAQCAMTPNTCGAADLYGISPGMFGCFGPWSLATESRESGPGWPAAFVAGCVSMLALSLSPCRCRHRLQPVHARMPTHTGMCVCRPHAEAFAAAMTLARETGDHSYVSLSPTAYRQEGASERASEGGMRGQRDLTSSITFRVRGLPEAGSAFPAAVRLVSLSLQRRRLAEHQYLQSRTG